MQRLSFKPSFAGHVPAGRITSHSGKCPAAGRLAIDDVLRPGQADSPSPALCPLARLRRSASFTRNSAPALVTAPAVVSPTGRGRGVDASRRVRPQRVPQFGPGGLQGRFDKPLLSILNSGQGSRLFDDGHTAKVCAMTDGEGSELVPPSGTPDGKIWPRPLTTPTAIGQQFVHYAMTDLPLKLNFTGRCSRRS